MASFYKCFLLISLIIGSFFTLNAQEYKYEIGGLLGGSMYMGDANKNDFLKDINPAYGVVFRYNANFRWAIKTNLLIGQVSGNTADIENVFPTGTDTSFKRTLTEIGGHAEFNFFPYSDKYAYVGTRRFTPYVLAGMGLTMAPGSDKTFLSLHIPLGVGVKYKVKNRINLGLEVVFRKLFGDSFEGTEQLDNPYKITSSIFKNKDWYSCMLFSVTWDFGPRKKPCNNANSSTLY